MCWNTSFPCFQDFHKQLPLRLSLQALADEAKKAPSTSSSHLPHVAAHRGCWTAHLGMTKPSLESLTCIESPDTRGSPQRVFSTTQMGHKDEVMLFLKGEPWEAHKHPWSAPHTQPQLLHSCGDTQRTPPSPSDYPDLGKGYERAPDFQILRI